MALFLALDLRSSLASALAIEISILSNFLMNEFWTFREDRTGHFLKRMLLFQVVSLVGALVQWLIFIAMNPLWLWLLEGRAALELYFQQAQGSALLEPIVNPPEVGLWLYASQLLGIAVATAWNFLANFHWTWKRREGREK